MHHPGGFVWTVKPEVKSFSKGLFKHTVYVPCLLTARQFRQMLCHPCLPREEFMGEAAFVPQTMDLYVTLCFSSLCFLQDFNKPVLKRCALVSSVPLGKKEKVGGEWGGEENEVVSGRGRVGGAPGEVGRCELAAPSHVGALPPLGT